MDLIYRIIEEFFRLTITVLPFFFFGAAFSAALETWLKPAFAEKYLKSGFKGVLNAGLLGAILPGCACATMPMAEGIKRKGASLGVVSAFIMVSPLLSPQTVILTYALLGLRFTLARVVFSLVGALVIGLVYETLQKHRVKGFVFSDVKPATVCCKSCSETSEIAAKKSFFKNFVSVTKELAKYFLIGMFIASLMIVLVPEDAIPRYIGSSGPFAYIAAVLVGIPVYMCEGEEIPITRSLLELGLGAGPAFAFMLGSIGTCIPTMIMAQKIIGKVPTIAYILFWFVFAAASGYLAGLLIL
jgi:uncharacterized protein